MTAAEAGGPARDRWYARHQPWDRLSLALARHDDLRRMLGAHLPPRIVRWLVYRLFAAKHPEYCLRYRRHERDPAVTLRKADQHRCIFVHIPKTAGVAVALGLFGNHGGSHLRIRDYRRLYAPAQFRRFFKFTVVREPATRLLSAYRFVMSDQRWPENRAWADRHRRSCGSFRDFVLGWMSPAARWDCVLFHPQTGFVLDDDGGMPLDFVGRFERLSQDFAHICRRLGVHRELPYANPTRRSGSAASGLDPAVRRRVEQLYDEDYARFYPDGTRAPADGG
jgi:hypothetical protein